MDFDYELDNDLRNLKEMSKIARKLDLVRVVKQIVQENVNLAREIMTLKRELDECRSNLHIVTGGKPREKANG